MAFCLEDSALRVRDARGELRVVGGSGKYGIDHRAKGGRVSGQHDVSTGSKEPHRAFSGHNGGDLHSSAQVVGHDQPPEADLFPEQIGDDRRGERGGTACVELRIDRR